MKAYCTALLLGLLLMPVLKAQTILSLEQTMLSVLEDLSHGDDHHEAMLPEESSIKDIQENGKVLELTLSIPLSFLRYELDDEIHEEIIEHFARPISDFGYQNLLIKAIDESGDAVELSEFLTIPSLAGADLNNNTDPIEPLRGSTEIKAHQLESEAQPMGQLNNSTIWLSAGHGWKYDKKTENYKTQRDNTYGVVEDFATIEMINYYLLKYLYQAGANVWTVRERDMNTQEVIVDNDDGQPTYKEVGKWYSSKTKGYQDKTYRYAFTTTTETAAACFQPKIPTAGLYWVSVHYKASMNRTTNAKYKIVHAGGESYVSINQEYHGDTWVYLGQFYFEAGTTGMVVLMNNAADKGQAIIADAVRFGGGMGTVSDCNNGKLSKEPRYEEAAKYYAAFQGYPDCVNDVIIRPMYAEWELSKGSMQEKRNAIYLSLHTNGSGGSGTETYLHSRRPVDGSWTLRQLIHKEVVNDIRKAWDPKWIDRGTKAADFGELRGLRTMPGIILELGFHDNPDEAIALTSPEFRKLTARAIYKGIVKYYAKKNGVKPAYLPEAPTHTYAFNKGNGTIGIRWNKPLTGGVYGDAAEKYKVYISRHGKAFSLYEYSSTNQFTFTNLIPETTYYFRISAVNKGGESFPSAVVAVRTPAMNSNESPVLIVDGFDRMDRGLAPYIQEKKPSYAPLGKVKRLPLEQMNNFDYMADHAASIESSGLAFDGATNEVIRDKVLDLNNYQLIDWYLGRESDKDHTLDAKEQILLKQYLNNGGNLIISGSEIAYDLDYKNNGSHFYQQYLKASYEGDNAYSNNFFSAKHPQFKNIKGNFINKNFGYYPVTSPDFMSPKNGGQAIVNYKNGKAAAVAYKGDYGLLNFGFPLESIQDTSVRNQLLRSSLDYLEIKKNKPIKKSTDEYVQIPNSFSNDLQVKFEKKPKNSPQFRLYNMEGLNVFETTLSDEYLTTIVAPNDLPTARYQYELEWNGQFKRGYIVKE